MAACKGFIPLVIAALLGTATPALAWGPTGHRASSKIAEAYLTPTARKHITAIIGAESLAQASTWADEMRSNPAPYWRKIAPPLHYVTVPPGQSYAEVGASPKGDAVTALAGFKRTLLNPASSLSEQLLALRFTIHIIADLHQPLHVGNGSDRGGTQVSVKLMGKRSDLHSVWDSGMIKQRELSYSEWAQWLGREITEQDVKRWSEPDPLVWIAESASLREGIYPAEKSLSWPYLYAHMPAVQLRLKQSGVRLAAYLNWLWAQYELQR
ncbi:MAG: S1/P1 nuclease [Gammaproteobacteria bacterium]|nr:S1/P1 nuclease [Gammaproteobacteria bacterium]